jgi:hypothetical protein
LDLSVGLSHKTTQPYSPLVAGDRQRRVLEAKAQQRGIFYAEMERTAFSYTSIKDYVTPEQRNRSPIRSC